MGTTTRHEQVAGHLPLEITPLIGRRQETADVRALLTSHRLVTVTGPGGIGKTRTILHVARAARRAFNDGAWFVELAPVQDPTLVTRVVLETLKIPDASARDPRSVLIEWLRGREILLVVDNCEHVLDASAFLVADLLRELPGVHVLASSRQALGVPGEATYRLDPLAVPDEDAVAGVTDLSGYPAVELFATRARTALGDFEVTRANRRAVVRLCARLEGLPLALELAASRLKVMTVEELLARLDDRFSMLKGTSHVAAQRHQTLLATVAWSHDLCTPAEQVLWRRASVFPGTFSLEAAEAVCSGDGLPRDRVLDELLGLVDKSVILNEPHDGHMRFRMLVTLREFGAEKLAEADESEALRVSHLAWTSARLGQVAEEWFGPRQAELTVELRLEQANIRGALDFCATRPGQVDAGLQMAGRSWFHWVACEYVSEGRLWFERLLAADDSHSPGPSLERALALGTTAWIASLQGDTVRGHEAGAECEKIATDLGDPILAAYGRHQRALAAFFGGRPAEAEVLFREARERYVELGAPFGWLSLLNIQDAAMHALQGDLPFAAELFGEVDSVSERQGEQWIRSYAVWGLALVRFIAGDLDAAQAGLRRAVEMKLPFHDTLGLALVLDAVAWVAAARGEALSAARTVGAASGLWSTFGADLFGSDLLTQMRDACEATARQQLGEAAYANAVAEGRSTTLDDTLRDLLGREHAGPMTRRSESVLTKREREIARLVTEGLTNQEIADRLVISTRTAEGHVENVLRKLDFRSRTQIAAWFTEDEAL